MANELNVWANTGLTVTAQLYLNGTAVGTPITCDVVTGSGGLYSGSMPTGLAAGVYLVLFAAAGSLLDGGLIEWTGTAEVSLLTIESDIDVLGNVSPGTPAGHELTVGYGITGATVTAKLFHAGAVVGSAINCPEIAGSGGSYSGSMPTGLAANVYGVGFYVGSTLIGSGAIGWNGTAEVTLSKIRVDLTGISTGGGGSGGITTDFTDEAMAKLKAYLAGAVIVVSGPVSKNRCGTQITMAVGDDYWFEGSRSIDLPLDGTALPTDLTGARCYLMCVTPRRLAIAIEGTITVPTGVTRSVRFEPTSADTARLSVCVDGEWYVRLVTADDKTCTPNESRGTLVVLQGTNDSEITV